MSIENETAQTGQATGETPVDHAAHLSAAREALNNAILGEGTPPPEEEITDEAIEAGLVGQHRLPGVRLIHGKGGPRLRNTFPASEDYPIQD